MSQNKNSFCRRVGALLNRKVGGAAPPPVLTAAELSNCSTSAARSLLDYDRAVRLRVLPLSVIILPDRSVLNAACSAEDPELKAELQFLSGLEIRLICAPEQCLDEAIHRAYRGDAEILEQKAERLSTNGATSGSCGHSPLDPQCVGLQRVSLHSGSGAPAEFLGSLLDYAAAHGASDVHIAPSLQGSQVRLRIDGELLQRKGVVCAPTQHRQLIARLKVLAGLDTTASAAAQDGSFSFEAARRRVFVRLSIMPTIHGEKAVLRLLGSTQVMKLETLGLHGRSLNFIERYLQLNEGALLVAGATGSGKTTTLYALLERLKQRNLSLLSIEDPVELQLEGVSQTGVNEQRGLDYSACLKAALRQDPDVLLVGEIRDEQSAETAFQAALTGHLLLSTVHARSISEVFLRLGSLKVNPLLIAQSLNVVVCQKLLPQLCGSCKVLDLALSNRTEHEIYQAVGCEKCGYSGYRGRVLAMEALRLERRTAHDLLSTNLCPAKIPELVAAESYEPLGKSLEFLFQRGMISWEQCADALAQTD